jgi:hypothetical protein
MLSMPAWLYALGCSLSAAENFLQRIAAHWPMSYPIFGDLPRPVDSIDWARKGVENGPKSSR